MEQRSQILRVTPTERHSRLRVSEYGWRTLWLTLLVLALVAAHARAQLQQTQSAQTGSGSTVSNGVLAGLTSGGQSGGVGHTSAGTLHNYAGFLAGIILQSGLDGDGDGLSDEMDGDNDGDGMVDAGELIADTDPTNRQSVLQVTGAGRDGDGVRVDWQGGVAARQYLLRKRDLADEAEPWMVIYTNEPPTDPVSGVIDLSATNAPYFYRIKAERP